MSRKVKVSSRYKKDLKRIANNPKLVSELTGVVATLSCDIPLDEKYRDHPLNNNWDGFRDCHIRPDVVLIYQKYEDVIKFLKLERVGSHSELGL
ncbi:MAG: type II toxin-antitoxin system YafQ family toxin [Kiritimatiellae bacterium]|nr:type II toxin-antitoxin system YafQ family toxin [Kiritimatiellia bacterium]